MMSKIDCRKLNKTISVEQDKSIFENLRLNDIPIASSCKGEGVCKWCKITVLKGIEHLKEMNDLEKKAKLNKNERLSCQIFIKDDIEITTTYW